MIEIIRVILIMTLSGSIMAILYFGLKPVMRSRLPKFTQYYLWLVVIAAFLVPVSKIIVLPVKDANASLSAMPTNVVNQYVVMPAGKTPFVWAMPETVDKENVQYKLDDKPIQNAGTVFITLFIFVYPFIVMVVLLYSVISFSVYIRLHRRRNFSACVEEKNTLESLCAHRRVPLLYRNPLAATPMLIGIFRPAIILPAREYTAEQLQAVLLHELIHLKRKDIAVRWLTVLACAIHWFNPVIWLVKHEIDRACELSCDEAVISGLDRAGKQNYGDTLIYLASENKMPKSIISMTMCEEKKALKERLGAIMKSKKHTRAVFVFSAALIIASAGAVTVLGAGSRKPPDILNTESSDGLKMTGDYQAHAGIDRMKPETAPEITLRPTPPVAGNSGIPGVNSSEAQINANAGQQSWQLNPVEVSDLTALPPLFHNDENVPLNVREAVRNAIVKEWTEAYGVYYQVLGFEANQVTYTQTGNEAELKFLMTMVTKNFDIDPDTVGYIKEAKEKDPVGYKNLYENYITPQTSDYQFRATMSLSASGDVELDTLWLYPHAIDFLPVKAENS